MSKFAITMAEYNRIHQVVHGVIKDEAIAVERSCTFFAILGSYFLNKHFGVVARPVAGGFALCVADGPKCVFYGKEQERRFTFGEDGFHMWVQTEDHIIDFMAPLYPEAFAAAQPDVSIPRKMFQRRKLEDKQDLREVETIGDFMVFPDPDMSEDLTNRFLSRATNTDLLNVADCWFGTRRGAQRPTISMGSNDGIVRQLILPSTIARSPW